jgi:hypothetical protein
MVLTAAFVGLRGTPLTPLSVVFPLFLIVIVVGDTIHMIGRFHDERREGRSPPQAALAALVAVGPACLFTSVTSGAGFLALLFTRMEILHDFGLVTALGIGLWQRSRALTLLSAATAAVLLWTTIPAIGLPDRVPPPAGTSPALRLFDANLHAANPDVASIAEEIRAIGRSARHRHQEPVLADVAVRRRIGRRGEPGQALSYVTCRYAVGGHAADARGGPRLIRCCDGNLCTAGASVDNRDPEAVGRGDTVVPLCDARRFGARGCPP